MQKPKSHIFNSNKGLVVWMSMRIWLRGAESLSYWRVGLRSKGSRIQGGGRGGRFLLTLSSLDRPDCFWLCFVAMPKSCFGILKGGELEGSVNKYYGGDIVGGVFSWWRAKTPPTTECFLPAAMLNTSVCWSTPPLCPSPTVYYTLPPLVVTWSGPLQSPPFFGQLFPWLVNIELFPASF